jgi:hypothetical protein
MMAGGFGSGSNGPMLVAVSLSKPAHNDQADLDELRNQEQKSTQQEISKEQAKGNKEIQQQAEQSQQEAQQKIEAEAQQAEQNVGPRGQAAIEQAAQQEIDKQNQAIQKQADQKQAQEDKFIAKQVKQQAAKKEKSSGQDDKEKFLESRASDPRLTDLREDLQKTKGVDKVTYPLVNKKGDAAVYTVTPTTAPSSRATEDLVNTLRSDVLPNATKGKQMSADVGGRRPAT